MSNKRNYWLCQLAGWMGMVAIETINYTFFIAGKFNLALFWTFVSYAVVGIISTHLYKLVLQKKHFFENKTIRIWLSAVAATVFISTIISCISLLPAITSNPSFFFKNVTFIEIIGTIINWMRYVVVWVIIFFMYKILQQKNTIQQEKLTIENLAKTTELELLKTQLNPHFLFNALNSIKALVIIDPEQSRDAIVKLSELLRFTLQYGKERLIPVKDEIDEVKKYLELEQLRFGKRLTIKYQIDANTLSQTLPPAIILTLAENAVKHGVAKQIEDGFITIKTSIVDNYLFTEVANNGNYKPNNTVGIGLKHITKRLEEVYHHQAVFTIVQFHNVVTATIKTPLSWA